MVRLQNPYIATLEYKRRLQGASPEASARAKRLLKEQGYDGVILAFADVKEIVLFEPSQVRSVNAAFDPTKSAENDILLSMDNTQSTSIPASDTLSHIDTIPV